MLTSPFHMALFLPPSSKRQLNLDPSMASVNHSQNTCKPSIFRAARRAFAALPALSGGAYRPDISLPLNYENAGEKVAFKRRRIPA